VDVEVDDPDDPDDPDVVVVVSSPLSRIAETGFRVG
jgi:hypothetical protein